MSTPDRLILKHPSGMTLHTMADRVEGFKELMRRASRWGGKWVLSYSPKHNAYIVGANNRPRYQTFVDIATCVAPLSERGYHVTLIPQT